MLLIVGLVNAYFVRQQFRQSVSFQTARLQFTTGFSWSLSLHQSLRLRQEVRHEDLETKV